MQFLLMCCFDEQRWNALPEAQRDDIMKKYGQWVEHQTAAGHYLAGGKLDASPTANTVRQRNGKAVVVDGPFSEAKEQIGGFHVIECADRDAAIAIAQTIPTLPAGGTIEVREQLWALGPA
jgi:hypothetical protein